MANCGWTAQLKHFKINFSWQRYWAVSLQCIAKKHLAMLFFFFLGGGRYWLACRPLTLCNLLIAQQSSTNISTFSFKWMLCLFLFTYITHKIELMSYLIDRSINQSIDLGLNLSDYAFNTRLLLPLLLTNVQCPISGEYCIVWREMLSDCNLSVNYHLSRL